MGSTELIRFAVLDDMQELLRMGEEFFNASGYSKITSFNKSDTQSLIEKLIDSNSILTDGKSAMIGFIIYPLFMNNDYLVSQELFWWVDEDKRGTGIGVDILKKAECVSLEQGAKVMMMLSINDLNGNKVNKLYESLGYEKSEQTYMRKL